MHKRVSIGLGVVLSTALFAGVPPDPAPVVVADGPQFDLAPGDTSSGSRVAIDDEGNFLALFYNVFAGHVSLRGGDRNQLENEFGIGPGARGAAVAAVGAGEFAVSWVQAQGYGGRKVEGSSQDVMLQRFEIDGTAVTGALTIGDEPTQFGARTELASRRDDGVWVVWEDFASGNLRARDVPFVGVPGPEFTVNSWTTGSASSPRVAMLPDGDGLVVWRTSLCAPDDTDMGCIRGRRINVSGLPLGDDFLVNSTTTGFQGGPVVSAAADSFVVAWTSNDCGSCVRARRLAHDGSPLGADFRVDEPGSNAVAGPGVAALPSGDFVVSWNRHDGPDDLACGRAFSAAGEALTGEFLVNSDTANYSYETDVAMEPGGHFVVVWASNYDLRGRRFDFHPAFFADDFESGDTTSWDSTVGR